jgi:hypothetical protein
MAGFWISGVMLPELFSMKYTRTFNVSRETIQLDTKKGNWNNENYRNWMSNEGKP